MCVYSRQDFRHVFVQKDKNRNSKLTSNSISWSDISIHFYIKHIFCGTSSVRRVCKLRFSSVWMHTYWAAVELFSQMEGLGINYYQCIKWKSSPQCWVDAHFFCPTSILTPPTVILGLSYVGFVIILTDSEPPWIQCPENIITPNNKHQGSSNVTLSAPVLRDNSGDEASFVLLFSFCLLSFCFCSETQRTRNKSKLSLGLELRWCSRTSLCYYNTHSCIANA